MEKEFNRLFSPSFESSTVEEAKQFLVKVDILGVDPKNIDIRLDHNTLTIKGEKENEHKEKKDNFIRYERSKGSFYRRIMLPNVVDGDKIAAKSNDGVLIVTILKSEKGVSKKIEVKD
ncbi:MAG: Hsp20/alpha crystallin family protein [Coxiellaceae bacterium]|nr:Hsp20/alpha crystallin family protein [Coxiellaceae bacterium]